MTITIVIINPQTGNETGVWMMSCPEEMGWEFGRFWKRFSWVPTMVLRSWGPTMLLRSWSPTMKLRVDIWSWKTIVEFLPLGHRVGFRPLKDFVSIVWYERLLGGCPRGVMFKAMDCGIVVSEFKLQSRYYVPFRANTLGKSMNPLFLLAVA